ncbi:MFS transporter, DHA2 family, methylenomycin A resistance protein [Nonomuraea maritima]|uniref:MFS transporter, DHA2 family, methylenomycin A resistance protein n=1 Tax=Nonomuraea maritima TaxID=683260 RepID=A0A1G8RVU7_9ACTN|nr:MFS transporter [Nonomuraea maritima]SDJ20470.1 MFS transporter, DHA2 family, methylenomycin A resistance protein [Nonomuraea maritima]
MKLAGFSLAYFLVLLDTTVLTIALPDLRASLGGSVAGQQWAVNAYTVAFAASLLVGGAVADRHGAARVFRAGVAAFGVLSLLSAAAPDLGALVVLRALLGVAGALCLGGSLGLLGELYPSAAARARATGVWAAITGAALAAGPLVGGLLVDLYGWRAVFLLNPPLALVSLLAVRGIRSPRGTRPIAWHAQALTCAFLGLLAEALTDSSLIAGALCLVALAALLITHHRTGATPTPAAADDGTAAPSSRDGGAVMVRARVRVGGSAVPRGLVAAAWPELLAGAAANFAFSGALFVLTLLLQDGRHLTPMETGLAFLPLTVPMVVNPVLTGRIVARHGARLPILAGLALLAGGLAGAARADGLLLGWLVVIGCGLSLCFPALMAGTVANAPAGTAGTAGGVLNAARQMGATLGVAVLGGFVAGPRPLLVAAAVTAATCAAYLAAGFRRSRRPATA